MKIYSGEAGEKDDKEGHLRLPRVNRARCRILAAGRELCARLQGPYLGGGFTPSYHATSLRSLPSLGSVGFSPKLRVRSTARSRGY